jgi:hypothetical protein
MTCVCKLFEIRGRLVGRERIAGLTEMQIVGVVAQSWAQAGLLPYTGFQSDVLRLRTSAEHLSCSLLLLGFIPMHSDSQQCLDVASYRFLSPVKAGSNPTGAAKF